MILFRFILIGLIVYLIVRSITRYGNGHGPTGTASRPDKDGKPVNKKISREIGEYVDYEEIRKK